MADAFQTGLNRDPAWAIDRNARHDTDHAGSDRETQHEPAGGAYARAEADRGGQEGKEMDPDVASVMTSTSSAPDHPGEHGSSAAGWREPYEAYQGEFLNHWHQRFENEPNERFELHQPAYRYGYNIATDDRYSEIDDWSRVEPSARASWDRENPGTWERYRESVYHSWKAVRNRQ